MPRETTKRTAKKIVDLQYNNKQGMDHSPTR